MIRRVLAWVTDRFAGGEEDGAGEETRFVPSELDESVRYAHGGGSEADRELAAIREEGRKLEEKRRNR